MKDSSIFGWLDGATLLFPAHRSLRNCDIALCGGQRGQGGESHASMPSTSSLPWLVLYCGANPKVEEVG